MKKLIFPVFLALFSSFCHADTTTSRLGLTLPSIDSDDQWGGTLNNNFSIIDSSVVISSSSLPNVLDYGAKCDGVTNDAVAINAAMVANSTGTLYFPSGRCEISSTLNIPIGIKLVGNYHYNGSVGTIIEQLGNVPVFTLSNTNQTGYEEEDNLFQGLHLKGGSDSIFAQNGGVAVIMRDMILDGPTHAGINMQGFIQQWNIDTMQIQGGQYGILFATCGYKTDGVTAGTICLFDKNQLNRIIINGQTINGMYIVPRGGTGNSNSCDDLILNNIVGDGVVLGTGISEFLFSNATTEAVGYTLSPISRSTATTTAGSANVVVGSTNSLVVGSTCTIAGADVGGIDWYPYILSITPATKTLGMSAVAPLSVTNADFTTALYSDFKLGGSKGATFINPAVASDSSISMIRYVIDITSASAVAVISGVTSGNAPIYDPTGSLYYLGDNHNMVIRPTMTYVSSGTQANNPNAAFGNNTYGDVLSMSLTRGNWDVSLIGAFTLNGATATRFIAGVGKTSGNNTPFSNEGECWMELPIASPTADVSIAIPRCRLNLNDTATIYYKAQASYSAGTPKFYGTMTATRLP